MTREDVAEAKAVIENILGNTSVYTGSALTPEEYLSVKRYYELCRMQHEALDVAWNKPLPDKEWDLWNDKIKAVLALWPEEETTNGND